MLIWGSWSHWVSVVGGWSGMHSHFCVQPNYSVDVVLWFCYIFLLGCDNILDWRFLLPPLSLSSVIFLKNPSPPPLNHFCVSFWLTPNPLIWITRFMNSMLRQNALAWNGILYIMCHKLVTKKYFSIFEVFMTW